MTKNTFPVNGGAVPSGLANQHRERQASLHALAKLRKQARAEINRLIAFLDQSDEYVMTELEDDGDLEDVGDNEPSLGSFDRMINQEKSYQQVSLWAFPPCDLEQDDYDGEPSLGSLDHNWSQEVWAAGGCRDVEQDLAESGIADFEGLYEQVGTQDWQHGCMG